MNIISFQRLRNKRIASVAAFANLLVIHCAAAESFSVGLPVQVSPAGEIVAEFSSATAPGNPQLMVASAIKRLSPAKTLCGVYVSRDGGNVWSEVPAWPDGGLQAIYDPWVAIGVEGTIHATGIARTNMGARAVYTRSSDQGLTWSPASAVTPFESKFHRRSADKDCLTVGADGTIYVVFNQVLTSPLAERGLIVARSTDQGLTWTTRDTGAAGFPNGIVTTPRGTVTVTFVGGAVPGYGTVTSTDGGDTWAAAVALGDLNPTNGLTLPSIVFDSLGRIVIGDIGGSTTPQIEISIETTDGTLVEQRQLPRPDSDTCRNGRLIQPALTAGPDRSPAFQIGCKIDRTRSTAGNLEVWVYPSVNQPALTPVQIIGFELPAGTSHDPFAKRFSDGGDYWSFTWKAGGWLSMWVDPRSAGGPGELFAASVTPAN
jgi:hypothetical protein